MGYFSEILTPTSEVLLFGIFIGLCVYFLQNKGRRRLPPGPRGLPILGYLPFMKEDPSVEFVKLSKKYGDIFSLYLGRRYVVVVTDAMKAKELLSKQSTADRPDDLFMLLPGGAGFAEANGEIWTEQRRYCIKEMKNLGLGTSDWEKLIEEEIGDFLDVLKNTEGKPKDIHKELSASISNNVLSLVTGQRLPTGHPKRAIIDEGVESFELAHNQSGHLFNFPSFLKLCLKMGLVNAGNKIKHMQILNNFLREQVEKLRHEKGGVSFIHKYFTEIDRNKQLNLRNSFNLDMLIGNVQAIIIAGSDTTKVSLLWLFLAMASFPPIQEKVHEEIDSVLGKDGKARWTQRNKLPYCCATMMETQRWRSVAPLNVMHRTNEDVFIDDYVIPKGTDMLAMISAFHHDTKYWKQPDAFLPERFISEDGKIQEPEAYMPFSHGKRICPGKTVALIEVFHYFLAIMQKFRILPASDDTPPDTVGITGLTLQTKPQMLRYVLR